MNILSLVIIGTFAFAAIAFVGGAMLWLRHLRTRLSGSLKETLSRQILHGQKVEEALNLLQRNQKQLEGQVRTLSEAQTRARSDINMLREKLEQREVSAETPSGHGRVIH